MAWQSIFTYSDSRKFFEPKYEIDDETKKPTMSFNRAFTTEVEAISLNTTDVTSRKSKCNATAHRRQKNKFGDHRLELSCMVSLFQLIIIWDTDNQII